VLGDTRFQSQADIERLVATLPRSAVFSAAPHGVSAALIDTLLRAAEAAGTRPSVVDISADYRYSTPEAYAAVYKHAHGAPARLADFSCAVPEHLGRAPTPHVAHPGCFATATLLAAVPLLAMGLIKPLVFVSGVTGSTGSGRKPVDGGGSRHAQHRRGRRRKVARGDSKVLRRAKEKPRLSCAKADGVCGPGLRPDLHRCSLEHGSLPRPNDSDGDAWRKR
jgi:N-acetyl-gamma-glutamyl-phosphate reductase